MVPINFISNSTPIKIREYSIHDKIYSHSYSQTQFKTHFELDQNANNKSQMSSN